MLRRIFMASVGAIALTGTAVAADLAPPVFVPVPFTWTGIYVGGQVGWLGANQTISYGDAFGLYNSFTGNANGGIGGAHGGYNLQFSQFVIGLEGDVDGASVAKSVTTPVFVTGVGPTQFGIYTSDTVHASFRGRAGLAFDQYLLYVAGGLAIVERSASIYTGAPFNSYDHTSTARTGWTIGGGVEYAVNKNWLIRLEYRYSDYGNSSFFPANYAASGAISPFVNRTLTENRVQVGFDWKFDLAPPAPAPIVTK